MNRQKMRDKLCKKLPPKRMEHSLGVEYTAACMAMCYEEDVEKAAIAGLLHDCAKYVPSNEKIRKCKKYKLPISNFELQNPELLHAKLSAMYAKERYEVEDEKILSAIMYHTTGKPEMSQLEKIIYIADFIEPNRKMVREMEQIRKEAFTDLDKCLIHIIRNVLDYLEQTNSIVDDITLQTYKYYCNNKE